MIMDGCEPNVVTYNRLIHSFGLANYIDKAIETFYHMQNVGIRPDRVTYCTLIDMHAKAGFLEVAMDMYWIMQKVGLTPDTFTYSLMINCLGKAGHLSVAYKLFCEMVSRGLVPNLVTYNILIALQAKARNFPSALKLYREMQAAGFHPDKITYSIIMEVLGHCGFLDEAESLFVEMKRKEWIPDEHVYGLLVDLWGKAGNVDKACGWYQLMLDSGLRPNVPTCNSLLSAFLRMHRFSDANDVLQTMLNFGLHPSLQTYTLLLSCCTEARSPIDMGSCGKLMAVTGHPAHTFLLTLPAAEPGGQNVRDHTGIFLDLMHSEDRESKRGLVDAVIDFLHKSGLKEEAGSIWEVAAKRNVYPDAVKEKRNSYWLINLHVMSDGTAVTALSRTLASFHKQILTSGVGPSRIDIITGWGRRSRVTGTSLVRQSVEELLHLFRFPFFKEHGNSGCFVGCGESLNQWLLHSYVERMHLL
ncbi:Pentatricopeptide repeat-containing protein [Acorus calamus]|uniref:Pentatricopeptide repeat-containing protein n=1 Tax=Acorus calamus TaxID=4465 RepID=A0AAV9E3H8_ACOCL|nr:Pentatricopeptide repeat-containing protein [Acorus calamus]